MNAKQTIRSIRTERGISQETLAELLEVSRQTISKWEIGDTIPDIRQAKRLAGLYRLTLDELIDFDLEVQEIQEVIGRTREEVSDKIDWTKAWSQKYPVLAQYQSQVDAAPYAQPPRRTGPAQTAGEGRGRDGKALLETFTWTYPHAGDVELPSKITATQLKGRDLDEEAAQECRRCLRCDAYGIGALTGRGLEAW